MRKFIGPILVLLALAGCKSETAPTSPAKQASKESLPEKRTRFVFDRPLYYDHELHPADDLEGRTLVELALMRNTIYARAGNKFRKKWLNDYFSAQPWYHPLSVMDDSKITAVDRKNAAMIAKYDATFGRQAAAGILRSKPRDLTPERQMELRLASERLGKWAGSATDARTPLEDPTLLDKQLTVEQLNDFSRRDLRLLRNLIYARRGRPFRSELIKAYFSGVDWYQPDNSYTDARLTALDHRNVNLIRSVEDSLGGPLTDWQHKTDDGWFAES